MSGCVGSSLDGLAVSTATNSMPNPRTRRARIMIVEDQSMVAMALQGHLENLGHEVVGVLPQGEPAVRAAVELRPDIALLDINLGAGMDGIEVARHIRGKTSASVIFITAYDDDNTRRRAVAAIEDAQMLTKPFVPRTLDAAIRHALEGGS